MKKLILSLCLAICFIGCNPGPEIPSEPQVSVEEDGFESGLEEVYSQALSIAKRQKFISKLDQIGNFGVYEYDSRKVFESLPDSINKKIFNGTGNKLLKSARVSSEQSVPLTPTVAMINAEIENSHYSAEQKQKLTSLVNSVFSPADPLAATYSGTVGLWMYLVINSPTLSSQQKKELRNYGTMVLTLFNFVKNGGVDQIYNEITEEMPEYSPSRTGRTTGCQINTRNVLIGAVWSGVRGAVSGGLIGAAGGTVTIPIFGTITGAVGGAVFGGASGFAYGVVDGIVTELISSCTRYVRSENASCREVLTNFMNANSATRKYLMTTFPSCFKLDDTNLVVTPTETNAEAVVLVNAHGANWQY